MSESEGDARRGLDRETIQHVAENTQVIRPPRQHLATFGVTNIRYYLVTEPSYADLLGDVPGLATEEPGRETVVREGEIHVERPKIVTPYYLVNLFQGFDHGREYAEFLSETYGPQSPGLLYSYRHDLSDTNVISDSLPVVVERLEKQIDEHQSTLAAIVRGVDSLWDISLMKFVYDLTVSSLGSNVRELSRQGMLQMTGGVPAAAHMRIHDLFVGVRRGEVKAADLKEELDLWGLFDEYQDRFFGLFRRPG